MKISMKTEGIKPLLLNLQRIEKGLTKVFKDGLRDEAVNMKLFAQAILSKESQERTGKRYWTGRLMDSIDSEVILDEPGKIEMVVGVDMEKQPKVADYAVPVEKGHRVGFGGFWEGYHYMEQALVEFAPKLEKRMAARISEVIRTPWRLRNIATGRWAPESTPKYLIR